MAARKKAARPKKTTGTKAAAKPTSRKYKLQDANIVVETRGRGKPILLLHSEDYYEKDAAFVDDLAKNHQVIMPWMPGFNGSTLPDSVRSVEDISYLYLDLLDQLKLKDVFVLGFSVGGWIALEMATKSCERLRKLALVTPVGAKFGGPYDRDIEDIYFHPFAKVREFKFHNVENDPKVLTEMNNRQAMFEARAREATAKLCWDPYFHNPSLRHRLNRVQVRTLLIWGASDGIVKPSYGRKFEKRIPDAKFVSIPKAGHFPHVEQPDAFMKELRPFLR